VSDHYHEPYEVYGTAATASEVSRLESTAQGLREDLRRAEDRIRRLEDETGREMRKLWASVAALEKDTPQARQAQYEADLAAADLAESGYGEDW
jgi:hypothetical protein